MTAQNASFDADIVWFCVPDKELANAAVELSSIADWKGKVALHSSGALCSDVLGRLRQRGAAIASAHPLMTFVHGSSPSLHPVPFGLEGDLAALRVARCIVKGLGGVPFAVRKEDKPAYHAWGMFASPLLLAVLVTAEQVAHAAGISSKEACKKMLPIASQTLANYAALGARASFSGPIVRGDVATVRSHLDVLKRVPGAREVYIALARTALRYLPVKGRKELEKALREKS